MSPENLILLIPDKPDIERDELARVWSALGGQVLRLGRFWDPPNLDTNLVRVYGGAAFVHVLQKKLGLKLCTPRDDLILSLPSDYLKRRIQKQQLLEAEGFHYPLFVKPLAPKIFGARVYLNLAELRRECDGLDFATEVLTSSVVSFVAEARTFLLEGKVLDSAFYEGAGDVLEAAAVAADLARNAVLPKAVVVDIGLIKGGGWAVVELNAAWGAGLNGCRAERVWPCIARV